MNGYFPVQTLVYPGHERTHQGRVAIYPFGESGWWRAKEDWTHSLRRRTWQRVEELEG